jgi:hypothetical protein
MAVELYECESSVCLHPDFDDITVALEQGDQVGLVDIGDQVANVDCRVVFRGLGGDDLIREDWGGRIGCGGRLRHGGSGDTGWTHHVGSTLVGGRHGWLGHVGWLRSHSAGWWTATATNLRWSASAGMRRTSLSLLVGPVDSDSSRS